MEPLGKKVSRMREERDWSQAELAKRSGIMAATLSRIESGGIKNPGLDILKALAVAFGISVDYLIGVKDRVTFGDSLKRDPEAQVIFRGYERLSPEERKLVKRFVETLEKDVEKE